MLTTEKRIDFLQRLTAGLSGAEPVIRFRLFEVKPGVYEGFVEGIDKLASLGPYTTEEMEKAIEAIKKYCKTRFPHYPFTCNILPYDECRKLQ